MSVSSRQRTILEMLLQGGPGLTVGAIAERIGVSARTIHRELDALEETVREHGLQLVRKSGLGVELQGSPEQKEALRLALFDLTTTEYTAEERKVIILCTLLEATEPVKLISLALDLKVTTATISHDLDDLEDVLDKYGLSLVRKRGYGVEIRGSESAKRQAISRLILDHLNEHELIGLIKENIQNKSLRDIDSISERLLGLVDKEKLIKVENALKRLDDDLPYPLADSAYIGLVIHLALAVERIEKGENIHFDEHTLHELQGTPEYEAAQRIMERMTHIFQMDIPAAEIGYITMHLRGAKLRSSHEDIYWPGNVELMAKTQRFIRLCEDRLQIPLRYDSSLFHGLLTHMEPALYRLKRQMEIRNPILEQIRDNYPELFQVVREAVSKVFPELHVPDEEIGYLVMHIGAAVERTSQTHRRYRALVVCSSGIGSSKILATRIKKEIPEIVSLQNLSLFEVGRIPKSEYDVIISTIPLPMDPSEYVVVSPLLPKEDIQKIAYHLHNLSRSRASRAAVAVRADGEGPKQRLNAMHQYAGHAVQLLDGFQLRRLEDHSDDIRVLLDQICGDLVQLGVIREAEPVVRQLLQRERLGGLGIPGTTLALFHGKYEQVVRPSFTVHVLCQPILLKAMDEREMPIHTLLMLLGPRDVAKEGLEVLSEVSSLLIEDEMIDALEAGDRQRIADCLAEGLYQFCRKKTGMERTQS
ncbi:mannitol operon transcriptional antiterminator [Brevibacillus aydinogluensis]|uniref:Transcriptional regulator n=1 Tax=Brevibacillus aydinogluensis TaxID=927786 RepID=A0AA48RB17_9BACL|nr:MULTISPECIES: BglG family transcription antiterminator [Brevibacillus]MBR8660980.1 BglG family transcription antiterminator [Brevibacillus sp. NL20B1]MDT3416260.1 mannitol operon transcriptional antiterminator [Brevibacillus aydinogluensis]CAJ1000808.1 Transcriptional regulator [Brevibacillus aydinogluensis]